MGKGKPTAARKLRPSRPTKFTLFPKLPPELRDKVWKFAVPGKFEESLSLENSCTILCISALSSNYLDLPIYFKGDILITVSLDPRIVTVDAGDSIIKTRTNISSNGIDTFDIKYKYKFKLCFFSETEDPGMLRACKESRHVVVKMLPIRLPSSDPKKEIRLGLHDVLAITNLEDFLEDMGTAHIHGLNIHPSISQIPALVIFSHSSFGDDLEDFMNLVEKDTIFQSSLQVLKSLQTLVFCCESHKRPTSVKRDCFLNYATNFDLSALNAAQFRLLIAARNSQLLYNELMNDWKLKEKRDDLKIPEIKIMAKGWPAK
jgi:hypothetical protein